MDRFTLSHEMDRCIRACYDCADVCTRTAVHCLMLGGPHAERAHQTVLHDCADMCLIAARFMGRASHRHALTCRACAELCRECADDCRRINSTDAAMSRCIETCLECAKSCEHAAAVAAA